MDEADLSLSKPFLGNLLRHSEHGTDSSPMDTTVSQLPNLALKLIAGFIDKPGRCSHFMEQRFIPGLLPGRRTWIGLFQCVAGRNRADTNVNALIADIHPGTGEERPNRLFAQAAKGTGEHYGSP